VPEGSYRIFFAHQYCVLCQRGTIDPATTAPRGAKDSALTPCRSRLKTGLHHAPVFPILVVRAIRCGRLRHHDGYSFLIIPSVIITDAGKPLPVRKKAHQAVAPSLIHPGEQIAVELDMLGTSASQLARELDIPANRVTEIPRGRRGITADSAWRAGSALARSSG